MLKQVSDLLTFYVGLVYLKAASAGAGWLVENISIKDTYKSATGWCYWIVLLIAQARQQQRRVQAAPAGAVLPQVHPALVMDQLSPGEHAVGRSHFQP